MDTIIVICCAVNFILLMIVLIKLFKPSKDAYSDKINELGNQIEVLKKTNEGDSSRLLDQIARQGETSVKQIATIGESLASSQDRQQNRNTEIISEIKKEMTGLRTENQESLTKINSVVTEKMQSTLDEKLNRAFETVVKNMSELGKTLNDAEERQQKSTAERLEALEKKFETIRSEINTTLANIRNSNTESMEKLRQENRESLDRINNTVNEKLQKTLDDKITQSFESVSKRLAEVHDGLGQMRTVASDVSNLRNVLANVKTRGIMGEIQLNAILAEILAPEQYGEQVNVNPANPKEQVDFAVRLPGAQEGESIYLPIDSKFPGDTYSNLVEAREAGDPEIIKEKRKTLENEIVRSAKSIHDKYIIPPYTTHFAIMFLPFEGLYAEVVNSGIVERLQREFSVNLAGPSTMAAMLNSLQMGFKTLAIQKKSGEVWKILEAAKKEFSTFEDVLTKTRNHLRMVDDNLDKLIGTRTKAINRTLKTVEMLTSSEEAQSILEDD